MLKKIGGEKKKMSEKGKHKDGKRRVAVVGLMALALLVLTATTANCGSPVIVSIGNIPDLPQGTEATIPVKITNSVQPVSSARISLLYDPTVVEITKVEGGDFDELIFNPDGGEAQIIGYQFGGSLYTPITFADVTVRAIGNPGETTPLNIKIHEINMGTGSPIYPRSVSNGSVTITAPPPAVPEFNIVGVSVLTGILSLFLVISRSGKREK